MSREEQLSWEARWGRPAGLAAILAGAAQLVSSMLFIPEDRDGIERDVDILLSIDEQRDGYLASSVLAAVTALLLTLVFFYLFRAVRARGGGGVPSWFVYIVIGAPLVYAIASVAGAVQALDIADQFTSESGPVRGEAGSERASDLGGANPALIGLATAGTVGFAFLFVMLPLRARRVGLLTPFMGILGVIAGVLVVFPLYGISPVIQAFWLGGLGMLLLGTWPGGRGPAWESGEAEPWPTAAQRRGDAPMPGQDEPAELDPDAPPPEPEGVPERPASRKRRKKR